MNSGIFFTDWFDVEPLALEDYGAFNISLINDLPLFIDPFLLFNSEEPIYHELHEGIIQYMRFLKDVSINEAVSEPLCLSGLLFERSSRRGWDSARLETMAGDWAGILRYLY